MRPTKHRTLLRERGAGRRISVSYALAFKHFEDLLIGDAATFVTGGGPGLRLCLGRQGAQTLRQRHLAIRIGTVVREIEHFGFLLTV